MEVFSVMAKCQIAERFKFRGITYELRWIHCNKSNCGTCPHGPYWYAIIEIPGQKSSKRYCGKHLKGAVATYYRDQYTGGTIV